MFVKSLDMLDNIVFFCKKRQEFGFSSNFNFSRCGSPIVEQDLEKVLQAAILPQP